MVWIPYAVYATSCFVAGAAILPHLLLYQPTLRIQVSIYLV